MGTDTPPVLDKSFLLPFHGWLAHDDDLWGREASASAILAELGLEACACTSGLTASEAGQGYPSAAEASRVLVGRLHRRGGATVAQSRAPDGFIDVSVDRISMIGGTPFTGAATPDGLTTYYSTLQLCLKLITRGAPRRGRRRRRTRRFCGRALCVTVVFCGGSRTSSALA